MNQQEINNFLESAKSLTEGLTSQMEAMQKGMTSDQAMELAKQINDLKGKGLEDLNKQLADQISGFKNILNSFK